LYFQDEYFVKYCRQYKYYIVHNISPSTSCRDEMINMLCTSSWRGGEYAIDVKTHAIDVKTYAIDVKTYARDVKT
jgi:hypothetical protein